MKKILVCLIMFNFVLFVPAKLFAEDAGFIQKIEHVYGNIRNNETVDGFISSIQSGWKEFKIWFSKLPGIRHYNESVYSDKNWKKEMNAMSEEYSPHLKSNSAAVQNLKEGTEKWQKL